MELGVAIGFGLVMAVAIWSAYVKYILGGSNRSVFLLTQPLKQEQKEILRKYFRFYNHLPPKSQRSFERRVIKFIAIKNFVPRNIPIVTEEMKTLIAASAIQLTFGFPNVFLSFFKHIIIFPDQFYSQEGKNYHKGEVNPKAKAIVLSWRHFAEGYASSEGVNLGLHEMAHALHLENMVMNNEFNFINPVAIKEWKALADVEIGRVRNGDNSFFRAYGSTNEDEFFAVAIELFFERPQDFDNYNRALYRALANVLQQDPIRLYKKL